MIKPPYQVNDRFELTELLGSGNFSEVYLARDRDPGTGPEWVAFKLFRSLRNKGRTVERALSAFEFQMLSRLRHPNLATVYDYGVDPGSGRAFFTMERLTGVDFLEAASGVSPLETLPLVVDACRALHHIHTRGLIHHDLKPGNLIVTHMSSGGSPLDQPLVKLTDFGLSTTFDTADDGYLRGTPEFMAPEMLAGREKDHRCDLYSLGVLLYLSLSGRFPFPDGRRPGSEEDAPPPLRGRNNEPVPAFLEDLVGRLLQADPARRYQTANEVIRDLALFTGTAYDLEPGAVGASSAAADTVLTITREQLDGLCQRLEHLGSGEAGSCRPALVVGSPGSGKSHLVLELRRRAQTSGAGFLIYSSPGGTASDKQDPYRLAEDLFSQARRIRRRQGSGVAVVLDAEEQGFAAISSVLRHLDTLPADESTFILVTGSPGEPTTSRLLQDSTPGGGPEQIRLRPLDLDLMARFLSLQLGNPVGAGDRLTACVLAESDGIPMLIEEALTHLQASGALTMPPSGPCFEPEQHQMDFTLPAGHLLDHHRPAAHACETESLQALAVFGAPATARLVAHLVGTGTGSETAVTRALDSAVKRLLVRETVAGVPVFRFRSLLVRNLVRSRLDEEKRRLFHRRAASAMERGEPTPGTPTGSLTWQHLALAGETAAAWKAGLDQGRKLEEALRFLEAGRVYEALINRGGTEAVPPDLASRLIQRAANLLRAAGKTSAAATRLEDGLALARIAGRPEQLARIRLETGYLLEKQGDLDGARETYRQGLMELPGKESAIYGDLTLQLGLNSLWAGRFEGAEQCLADCREAYRISGHPGGTEACLFLEAYTLKSRQHPDAAVVLIQRWLTGDGSASDTVMSGRLKVLLGEMLYHLNRSDEADRLFGDGMKIFKRRGERTLEAITLANRGALHFEQGRFSTAGRYNLDCLRAHEQMGNRYGQALSQYNLGVCDYHRGRYDEAMEHLRAARGIYEYIGDVQGLPQCINMEAELCLTLGDTHRAAERLNASAAALGQGDAGYAAGDRLLLEAELLLHTAGPKAAEAVCRRSKELFSKLGDTRQLARTAMLTARCLAAQGRAAEAEAALATSAASAEGMNAPRLRAELLLAQSELRNRFGLGLSHKACAVRCREVLDELVGVEDPDFQQSLFASLGRHLEASGNNEESMAAFHQAFELLRKVAGRFAYLSAEQRSGVVRRVAEWSRNKNRPIIQANTEKSR